MTGLEELNSNDELDACVELILSGLEVCVELEELNSEVVNGIMLHDDLTSFDEVEEYSRLV